MTKLMIIVGSVREGRIGSAVAEWVDGVAETDGRFEVDLVELADLALPLMDEPHHPRLRQYTKPYTIEWSRRVEATDAFIFVTPEYNHSFSPALKNALDYLMHEWKRKPFGFVSYGGVSAGTRGVVALRPAAVVLGLVQVPSAVEISYVARQIDEARRFQPTEQQEAALAAMLDELVAFDAALRPMRPELPPLS